ncbi:EipB family protein [Aureimonas fodinaquatilis]|nr:DUF1849 family protein [Aureimonas fodinaquatilis]
MPYRHISSVILAMATLMSSAHAAWLRPHQAVYDLSLATQTDEIIAVEGRIAYTLKAATCDEYEIDYRFAARFHQQDESTLTDQRTLSKESDGGNKFDFEIHTFVDGQDQGIVKGTAINEADSTAVAMVEPVQRKFELPLSRFPLAHTSDLISRAQKGERFVESRLFDGDVEAEKLVTTTSVILPAAPGREETVKNLKSWRIDESYFNNDSNENGMPVFRARYRLYENGVSDEMRLDFGDYELKGKLSDLTYLNGPAC